MVVFILVPRAHNPSGLRQGSRALAGSKLGSPWITDFRLFYANSEVWKNSGYLRLQKCTFTATCSYFGTGQSSRSLPAEGSWALGTRVVSRAYAFAFSFEVALSLLNLLHTVPNIFSVASCALSGDLSLRQNKKKRHLYPHRQGAATIRLVCSW